MKLTRFVVGMSALICMAGCRTQTFPNTIQKDKLSTVDALVAAEIEKGNFPGAVVCVGQGDEIIYQKAFGNEVIEPYQESMSEDTIFDMASISKPVGTATSIMILLDRKQIDLDDKVGKYLPAFAKVAL